MSDLRVSVCIPTYNRAHYLKYAITSLLEQSEPLNEIAIIDDGSTDNTEEVVRSFGNVSKIKYYKFNRDKSRPRHLTMVETFNHCIDKASFDYMAIVGDDDLVSYKWCENVKKAIKDAGVSIKAFHFSLSVIDKKNRVKRIWKQVDKTAVWSGADILANTNIVFSVLGSFVFEKDFMIDIGGYSNEFGLFFDKEFYFRLLSLKMPIYFSTENIFFSKVHKEQIPNVLLHGNKDIKKRIDNFLENSRYICRMSNKYKDLLLKEDSVFKLFFNKNYFLLFGKLFTNSLFFKEISFLYAQGLSRGIIYRGKGVYRKNCEIISGYFNQFKSLRVKLFLLLYFLRYWVYFVNIKGRFLAFFPGKKDKNLLEVT